MQIVQSNVSESVLKEKVLEYLAANNKTGAMMYLRKMTDLTLQECANYLETMGSPILRVIKSPASIASARGLKVFLAGSIEMGVAENWQSKIATILGNNISKPITLYNPRRDNWDSSWAQEIENDDFYEQVRWELQALDDADIIAMYFDPNTKSPISLLELGLYARSDKLIVGCPDGFYRKGNVEIVCNKYKIKMLHTWDDFVKIVTDMCNDVMK